MALEKQPEHNLLNTLNELEQQLDAKPDASLDTPPDEGGKEAGLSTEQLVDLSAEQNIQAEAQESAKEKAFEQYAETDDENPDSSPYVVKKARAQDDTVKDDHAGKSVQLIKVEELMTDGLGEAYFSMTPEQQQKFKKKGEETAQEMISLMDKFKLTAKKALKLLRGWLKGIPGVNKFFLEQEAKIKTEEVMRFAEEQAHQKSNN